MCLTFGLLIILPFQITDLALYISKLKGEEGENEAPYVQHIKAILASDKKDTVFTEIAKDASIFLTENDRGEIFDVYQTSTHYCSRCRRCLQLTLSHHLGFSSRTIVYSSSSVS